MERLYPGIVALGMVSASGKTLEIGLLVKRLTLMNQIAATHTKTVLLIEPDLATRQLYSRALQRMWSVLALSDVETALSAPAIKTLHAAVIEPYIGDQEIDWGQLAQLRDKLRASQQIPLILCSTLDARGAGYAWGATAYLLKPVSPEQLVRELASRLKGS